MTERKLRLLRALTGVLRAIHEEVRTIRDQQERQNRWSQIPRQAPILRAALQVPEQIERSTQANSDREYRVQMVLAVGTWLTFFAAAIYAGIAHKQLRTFENTAQRQLRAYTQPGVFWFLLA
jgi:hypothetical protein